MQNDIAGARADFMAAIALSPPDANGKDAVNVARTRMAALPPIPGGQPPGANPTLVALPNLPSVVPAASSAAAADSAKPAALLPPATSGSAPGLNAVAPTAAPPAATAAPTPAFMPPTAAITPGRRAALVIGNAAYRNMSALKNPRNDAEDVAAALRSLGFATILATDLDHGGMNGALDRFSRIASEADIAIVYYSGHGMQFAGTNYLLPVDARLQGAEDVNRFRLTPIDDVLATLNTVRGARILVLDACRNNPVEADMKRRLAGAGAKGEAILARGLKPQPVGNGLLVVYATQANDVADDGTGRNSPFTSAFLRHVGTADVDVRQMMFSVQDDVYRTTASRQRPEVSSSIVGEFKLKIADNPAQGATPARADLSATSLAARDWQSVQNSTNRMELEAFIRRYPESFQAELARLRLEEFKKPETADSAATRAGRNTRSRGGAR